MKEYSTKEEGESRVAWKTLEAFARREIERFLQRLLEEEVAEKLGRDRYERRDAVDAPEGYRNGHGKVRRVSLTCGTIQVRRPRVRGLSERLESRILPLFKRRSNEVGALLPELYLHGLAEGDFDLALRGLLGDAAPLSASSIARLKAVWQAEYDAWKKRSLKDMEVVYAWADGVYVKAGLEKEKAALLVVVGALRDGSKRILTLESGFRESIDSWSSVLRGLRTRGLNVPKVVVADGHLGIWGAATNVWPEAAEQRCWNHRILNVLDKVSKKEQKQAKLLLSAIPYAETREQAEKLKKEFQNWCEGKGQGEAAATLDHDWDRMVTFYAFPKEHWKHLRTSNVVESPFATVRLRTTAAKRYKKVENATAVVWKVLLIAENSFRKLDEAHLLAEVAEGAVYVNGVRVRPVGKENAA